MNIPVDYKNREVTEPLSAAELIKRALEVLCVVTFIMLAAFAGSIYEALKVVF